MVIQWHELLVALALVLVVEGILPFINPQAARRAFLTLANMDDRTLRVAGIASMALGLVVLYWVRVS